MAEVSFANTGQIPNGMSFRRPLMEEISNEISRFSIASQEDRRESLSFAHVARWTRRAGCGGCRAGQALGLVLAGGTGGNVGVVAFLWRKRQTSFRDGELFRLYMVGYALIRFPMEFLRYQPTPVPFLELTLVQWLCIAAVLGFGWRLVVDRQASAAQRRLARLA